MDAPGRVVAERRLNTQIDASSASGAATIFIPGNHDWARTRSEGWDQVRREGLRTWSSADGRASASSRRGAARARSRWTWDGACAWWSWDTQWWLQKSAKPVHPTSTCPADSEGEVLGALRDAVRGAAGRHVFVVGHHPLASGGPHGGHFPVVDHLFPLREFRKWLWLPLPIVGSAYPLARQKG